MTIQTRHITADELLEMGDIGPCELIDGEIIPMAPAPAGHGRIAVKITLRIGNHVESNRLGEVYGAETGFTLGQAGFVRAPDVAFVRKGRVPKDPWRFFDGAPDLAVEVVSPSDRWANVEAKVEQWLAAGTQSVWVADPVSRTIKVYRAGMPMRRYQATELLTDEAVLPGFSMAVADVFDAES